jgi:Pectate lyase superfamily protein
MAHPTPSSSTTNPSHSMLHTIHYNVMAYGAVGDGVSDDTTAVRNTIAAAYEAHQPVFFPGQVAGYNITTTIDLTPYPGTVLIGEGSQQGVQGQMGRASNIGSGGAVSPVFKYDGNGNTCDLHFENLGFNFPECAVRISDSANVTFKNCTFAVSDTGGANNTCVLLENMFWAWFKGCAFTASSTSDPAVILRGKEPSVNADHCYLIRFEDCRFWQNGVLYKDQNDIAVDASLTEVILFDGIDTESFDSNSYLITFTKSASTNWGGRYIKWFTLRDINYYDYSGTPGVVRFDIPNGFQNFVCENIHGSSRLFERTGGSGNLDQGWITGAQAVTWPLKDGSGVNQNVNRIQMNTSTLNLHGTAGNEPFLGFFPSTTASAYIGAGVGTPEGAVAAPVGSLWLRTDGGAGTSLYVKQTGTGNTGWVGK